MSSLFQPLFKRRKRLVDRRRGEKDLGRAAPDHHLALGHLFIGLNVGPQLLGQIALILALLDVAALQTLDVILIENRGHGPDPFEEGANGLQLVAIENVRCSGRLEHVFGENVPAREAEIIELGQGDEVLDQRAIAVGALAQANGCHLGKGADRLGDSLADGFHAGHQGGRNRPHSGDHDS